MSARPLFVVIYPYKFHDFTWSLLELDYFKPFVDILVLDISLITTPGFSKDISAKRSVRDEVIICNTTKQFIGYLSMIRRKATDTNVTILNEIIWTSPRQFYCNSLLSFFLRKRKINVFDLFNGGVSFASNSGNIKIANQQHSFFLKVKALFKNAKTWAEFSHQITSALLNRLAKAVPKKLTHRLVAGDEWIQRAEKSPVPGLQFVRGHSHDFSTYLLNEKKNNCGTEDKKTAVLLDSAGPAFASDTVYTGFKVYRTSEAWYPALVRFFELLETQADIQVEIAGHYKSAHSPRSPYFGGRLVSYGRTVEMVKESKCVLTINSTATSFAVIFRKPVIFIYSDQLAKEDETMEYIHYISSVLGTNPINIDQPPEDLSPYLVYNAERYEAYEKKILTSDPTRRPNAQIIMEEIMGMDTGNAFNN